MKKETKESKEKPKVKLGNIAGYSISVDKYNFMAVSKKNHYYYRTLEKALLGIRDKCEREGLAGKIVDLDKAIDKIQSINRSFAREIKESLEKSFISSLKNQVTEDFLLDSVVYCIQRGWIPIEEARKKLKDILK